MQNIHEHLYKPHLQTKQSSAMSKYTTIDDRLKQVQLKKEDKELLRHLEQIVLKKMGDGTPSVTMVADGLHMHPMKLQRKLKGSIGLTPGEYITIVRLKSALGYLADYPRYSITQVAQICGYADNSHFTHVFQRWFDTSPQGYLGIRVPIAARKK